MVHISLDFNGRCLARLMSRYINLTAARTELRTSLSQRLLASERSLNIMHHASLPGYKIERRNLDLHHELALFDHLKAHEIHMCGSLVLFNASHSNWSPR